MTESNKLQHLPNDDQMKLLAEGNSLAYQVAQLSDINRRLRRKIFDHYTVFEISRHLSSMLDTKSLLDAILLTCLGQMGVDGAVILLTDSKSKRIANARSKGIITDGLKDVAIDYNSRFVEVLLKLEKPLTVAELLNHLNPNHSNFRLLKKLQIQLIAPMIMKNKLMGILLLTDKISGASFYENDLEFLSLLMNQLSVALENARLYEQEHQINEELQRTQKLLVESEKMAALGKLSASIAHEVNNPLGIINNYLQILSIREMPKDVYSNYIKILKEEVKRIAGIVNQLLDFYRPHQDIVVEVDLKRVIAESLTLLSHLFTKTRVDVQMDIQKNLPVISGSPEKLKQVFLNLLMNAIEALPRGGKVKISAKMKGQDIEIEVGDNGAGIVKENLSKIFEPFYTTKERDGIGLGLSVCYGIVQWHQGNISVHNNSDGGATFRISLPIKRKDEQ